MSNTLTAREEQIIADIDRRLEAHGKPKTEANRDEYGRFYHKTEWAKIAGQRRRDAKNERLMADRESRRTDNHSAQDILIGQQWAQRNKQVIGTAPRMVSIEFAITTGRAEHDAEVAEIAAAQAEGRRRQVTWEAGERQRIAQIIQRPYSGQGLENLPRLDDAAYERYKSYGPEKLAEGVLEARKMAQIELGEVFSPSEISILNRFLVNQDPVADTMQSESWIIGFRVLVAERVIRVEALPTHKIVFKEPELPKVVESSEPTNPYRAGTLEHDRWERDEAEKGAAAEVDAVIGASIQEIATASKMTIPRSLVEAVVMDLKAKGLAPTRYNVRRSFAYLRGSEVPPNVYDQAELDSFKRDEQERLMSADEYKKLNYGSRV